MGLIVVHTEGHGKVDVLPFDEPRSLPMYLIATKTSVKKLLCFNYIPIPLNSLPPYMENEGWTFNQPMRKGSEL